MVETAVQKLLLLSLCVTTVKVVLAGPKPVTYGVDDSASAWPCCSRRKAVGGRLRANFDSLRGYASAADWSEAQGIL